MSSVATRILTPYPRPSLERLRVAARAALSRTSGDVAFVLAVCYHACSTELVALQRDILAEPYIDGRSPYDADSRRAVLQAYQMLFTDSKAPDVQTAITELQTMGVSQEICALLREHLDPVSPQHAVSVVAHVLLYAARLKE